MGPVCSCVGRRLLDVLMQESRLYLIFEFLSMDLKKYLDSIPPGQYMDPMLVKVRRVLNFCLLLIMNHCTGEFSCRDC